MIRRGRIEGWLKLPISALRPWAEFNGVTFNGIKVDRVAQAGSGVIADRHLKGGGEGPLMTIPRDLVLSLERVKLQALADFELHGVLTAVGDFALTTRGAIMIFLLHQATLAYPQTEGKGIGSRTPFIEYIKFLPEEVLPTFWSIEERYLLTGTTLKPAVDAKLKSLQNEFGNFRSATERIRWCSKHWWDDENGLLEFDDWLQVDAMYRSRALEFPGIGDCMVPCIDMANHAAGIAATALYEVGGQDDAVLLLRDGVEMKQGGEITITYGDDKGACEMVFSYGFIDNAMTESAKEMFLGLEMPADDPLGLAKLRVSATAPGVKLTIKRHQLEWYSDFIWIICVNEEDGLEFKVLQTVDGGRELQILWKEEELKDTTKLRELLEKDPLWDVYQLRAASLILERVEAQKLVLEEFSDVAQTIDHGEETAVREIPWELATRLRTLERELIDKAYQSLEEEVDALTRTDTVQRYLADAAHSLEGENEVTAQEQVDKEDFS